MKFNYFPIFILTILICIIQRPARAQNFSTIIQGNVLDAETNRPISKVNVFLSGTTLGASTDANGRYIIRDSISTGKYTVVFSHIKYKIEAKELSLDLSASSADTIKLNVLLIPTKTTLEEITIKADKDLTWKRRFKHFEEEFLGTSALGRRCKITNPWVLDFKQHRDTLIATANEEIIVENKDLGYKIYCKLVKFHNIEFVTNYLAYYRFKKLPPSDNKQARKWERVRAKAYYGSFQHFASSLLHNRLSKDGFYIKYSKIAPQNLGNQDITSTITADKLHNGKEIIMPHYLNIVYNQREEMAYIKAFIRQGINLDASTRYNQAISQSSWISINGGKLKVSDLGIIMDDPTKLQTYGYWAWQRVGNLLPSDFIPGAYKQTLRLSKIAKVRELTQFTQSHPQEKVYLHQDKPYYAIGDTVWISGYVVDAKTHQPTKYSGVLYVDLIDPNKQLKKQLKLKIENGKTAIDIPLDTSCAPGTYHLRAYTKLMTFGDRQLLFQREFEVGQMSKSTFEGKLTYQNNVSDDKASVQYKLALQDQFGQMLSNQSFDLLIKTKQRTYIQQKITTDAQGIIKGKLNIPSTENSPYLEIIAQTKDKNYNASRSFHIPVNNTQKQLSFFPEGGNLIAGNPNRVAFKAINRQGLGVSVKGTIEDAKGKEVATFESTHLGMGSFRFIPKPGKKYTAVIDDKHFELPQALSKGFVLGIQPSPQNRSILLLRSSSRKRKKFTIIAHCRGKAVFTISGEVNKKNPFNTMLYHNQFPSGILTITVFDDKFKPQCERIIFSSNPQKNLQIEVDTTLKVTAPQEKVTLDLMIKNLPQSNAHANLSVAVVDESLVKQNPQHTHILSQLLLTSDIKGYIERPNFYFKDDKLETRKALDLLMLTQGWRRFTWQNILANKPNKLHQQIEKSLKVSGIVTKPNGRPVANASVTMLSLNTKLFKVTQSNQKGKFTFDDLHLYKGDRLVFKAVTKKGRTKLKVKLDKIADTLEVKVLRENPRIKPNLAQKEIYLQNQVKQIQVTKSLRLDPAIKMLEEVQVSAKKITGQQYTKRNVQLYSQPSYRIRLDSGHFKPQDNELFMNYIQNKIPNLQVFYLPGTNQWKLTFRNSQFNSLPNAFGQQPAEVMILIDGQPADTEVARALDLENVAYIDMLSSAKAAMYGMMSNGNGGSAFNGILAIYTKKKYKHRQTYRDKGIRGLTYKNGYSQAREFYVPPYDNPNFTKNKLPDYRSTIYWNPSVKVVNGKAKVSFFNADAITNYRVIVEGISDDGAIGRKVYVYKVKGKE